MQQIHLSRKKVAQILTNIRVYAYLTELHVLKLYLKYVRENSIDKTVLRVIHNLELSLPQDGRNIRVITQSSDFRTRPSK
jgi:hypothetical protein